MRLICFKAEPDGQASNLTLREYVTDIPEYACLSHRWGKPEEEVSYQDFISGNNTSRNKRGYAKLLKACEKAAKSKTGLDHVWIDTCCIDKTSSAELSEAINSMFKWYQECTVCIAYLDDAKHSNDPKASSSSFRNSAWFTRGWTLQELVAPPEVLFFDEKWLSLGNRYSLAILIERRTGIHQGILTRSYDSPHLNLESVPVATRMSWASGRKTTRVEDRAYSLLGLFEVNMATIYGEGERAFERLQQEIMRVTNDHTIFAWKSDQRHIGNMIAISPDDFGGARNFTSDHDFEDNFTRKRSTEELKPDFSMTNYGLHIQLPIIDIPGLSNLHIALLQCRQGLREVAIFLASEEKRSSMPIRYRRVSYNRQLTHDVDLANWSGRSRLMFKTTSLWILGTERQLRRQRTPAPPENVFLLYFDSAVWCVDDMFPPKRFKLNLDPPSLSLPAGTWATAILRDPNTKSRVFLTIGSLHTTVWFCFRPMEIDEKANAVYKRFNILSGGGSSLAGIQVAPAESQVTLLPKERRGILDKLSFLQDVGDMNMQMSMKIESVRSAAGSSEVNEYGIKIRRWVVMIIRKVRF